MTKRVEDQSDERALHLVDERTSGRDFGRFGDARELTRERFGPGIESSNPEVESSGGIPRYELTSTAGSEQR
ncbi:hypothetical protein GCM10029976_043110 [Kribbella albertanoniae]|uniref:Uncharacterized protein n=1 Tax=Kribbella albertanoniae TaxID=1266829 RepID=A0A4R4Q6W8_9ACTN|nr:hypothetical protein [Kribbella albertanoniae]TDC30966.1 hypothetical protein E1261_11935 [Kribbella albertanoniae]